MLRLDDLWIWDSWVADDGDLYHLYFLQAPRSLGDASMRHVDRTWYKTLDLAPPGTTGPALTTASETWRDPLVLPDPGGDGWHMLLTARAVGAGRNDDGVVAHATST